MLSFTAALAISLKLVSILNRSSHCILLYSSSIFGFLFNFEILLLKHVSILKEIVAENLRKIMSFPENYKICLGIKENGNTKARVIKDGAGNLNVNPSLVHTALTQSICRSLTRIHLNCRIVRGKHTCSIALNASVGGDGDGDGDCSCDRAVDCCGCQLYSFRLNV